MRNGLDYTWPLMKLTLLLAVALLTPAFAFSQTDQKLAASRFTRGNQTLILKGYGKSNLELDTSTTPTTLYHIDSITKNLTAAAVVQLAEQRKLNLDDLVEKYVPQIHAIAPGATVRSLMNHTSGIPDYTSLGPKSENIEAVAFTQQDFLAAIQGAKAAIPALTVLAIQQLRLLPARTDHRESLRRNLR